MSLCATPCEHPQVGQVVQYGDSVLLGLCGGMSGSNWLVPGSFAASARAQAPSIDAPAVIQYQNLAGGVTAHQIQTANGQTSGVGPVLYGDIVRFGVVGSDSLLFLVPVPVSAGLCSLFQECMYFAYGKYQPDQIGDPYYQFQVQAGVGNNSPSGSQVKYGDSISLQSIAPVDTSAKNPSCGIDPASCSQPCLRDYSCGLHLEWYVPFQSPGRSQQFIPYRGKVGSSTLVIYQAVPLGSNYQPAIPCVAPDPCTGSVCAPPVCVKPGVCAAGNSPQCTVVGGNPVWSCQGSNGGGGGSGGGGASYLLFVVAGLITLAVVSYALYSRDKAKKGANLASKQKGDLTGS